jgi:hypothetical protein
MLTVRTRAADTQDAMRGARSMHIRAVRALACAAAIMMSGPLGVEVANAATDPASIKLIPHRAIYDLKLKSVRSGRAIESVSGRILYDFTGNVCDGYALEFRQVSALDSGEGKSTLTDQETQTWEDGKARSFRFSSKNRLGEKVVSNVVGKASRDGRGLDVSLSKPLKKSFDAGVGMAFPTEQIRRIIAAARDGQTTLALPVYDGSEDGQKIYDTLAVIGKPIAPDQRLPTDAAKGKPQLKGLTRWPVTLSYFERTDKKLDKLPTYTLDFELYENGISRALTIDYNDFVLTGVMSSLDIRDPKACK